MNRTFHDVPEVLNVHLNEIYKKLTITKENKLKFEKIFLKITFSFSKVNFSLLGKKIFRKKVDFFYIRSHEHSELLTHHVLQKIRCATITATRARPTRM